jgi:hypothetical protein
MYIVCFVIYSNFDFGEGMKQAETMQWAWAKAFEMASLISINQDEHGLSKTITRIVNGNIVIVDDVKFNESQKEYIHLEITAEKDEPSLSIKLNLPYDKLELDQLNILRKINSVNSKLGNPGIFFNAQNNLCEYKSYISFTGYHYDKHADPDFEEDFSYCQDQAAINWMLSALDAPKIWLSEA